MGHHGWEQSGPHQPGSHWHVPTKAKRGKASIRPARVSGGEQAQHEGRRGAHVEGFGLTVVTVAVLAAIVLALMQHAIPTSPAGRADAPLVHALTPRRVARVGAGVQ